MTKNGSDRERGVSPDNEDEFNGFPHSDSSLFRLYHGRDENDSV